MLAWICLGGFTSMKLFLKDSKVHATICINEINICDLKYTNIQEISCDVLQDYFQFPRGG
jgi:hypothetical protein